MTREIDVCTTEEGGSDDEHPKHKKGSDILIHILYFCFIRTVFSDKDYRNCRALFFI